MSAAPGESGRPRVVFVCVKNAGKSQMAAGLMRKAAGEVVAVDSAWIHRSLGVAGAGRDGRMPF